MLSSKASLVTCTNAMLLLIVQPGQSFTHPHVAVSLPCPQCVNGRGRNFYAAKKNNVQDGGFYDDFEDFGLFNDMSVSDEEEEEEEDFTLSTAGIWSMGEGGEIAALTLPTLPSPDLSAEEVAMAVIHGLQYNNVPTVNTGLIRCYDFMTPRCKMMVTGHKKSQKSLDNFIIYCHQSSKMDPFLDPSASIEFGPVTKIPAFACRGEIASMSFKVKNADGNGKANAKEQTFMIRLEKQRGPPATGAYLVTDLFDMASARSSQEKILKTRLN